MRRFGALGCFLPLFKKGFTTLRSIAGNHPLGSEIIGSSRTPSGTRRTRTASPSKRNSRGSRTAWLRPFLKNLATPLLPMVASNDGIYHTSIPIRCRPRLYAACRSLRSKGCRVAQQGVYCVLRALAEGQSVSGVPSAEEPPCAFKSQSEHPATSLFSTFREGPRSALTAIY